MSGMPALFCGYAPSSFLFGSMPEEMPVSLPGAGMKIVFLGPPGAGKGTMATRTHTLLDVPHVSTGELFRENIANETSLGLKVKDILSRGDLVSDEITVAMVKIRLEQEDAQDGFILDGFPRTIAQAEALGTIAGLHHVINLLCPTHLLVRRLGGRRFCPQCARTYHIDFMPPERSGVCDDDGSPLSTRDDDKQDAVQNRLKTYAELTEPLVTWYRSGNLLRELDASGPPDSVFESIRELLGR